MTTEVGNFPQFDGIDNRTEWDEKLAKSIFYQYIMPGKNSTNQAAIKKNLLSWMGKKGKWERMTQNDKIKFNRVEFNTINKKVLDELLETNILTLNDNANQYTEINTQKLNEEGELIDSTINFGSQLRQDEGVSLQVEDLDKHKALTDAVISGKSQLKELNKENITDDIFGFADGAKEVKETNLKESIKKIEEELSEMKGKAFKDDISINDIIENKAETQRFYQLYSMDPEDKEAAKALAILIDYKNFEFKQNPELFEKLYGYKYKVYEQEIEEVRNNYLRILEVPAVMRNALITDKNEPDKKVAILSVSKEDLIEILHLNNADTYPIKVREVAFLPAKNTDEGSTPETPKEHDAQLDNEEELNEWLKTSSQEEQILTLEYYAAEYVKNVLEPVFGKAGSIEISVKDIEEDTTDKFDSVSVEERKRGKDEFINRPITMTKEEIETIVIKGFVNPDSLKTIGQHSTKAKQKSKNVVNLPIIIGWESIDTETIYAKRIGASSKRVIGTQQHPLRKIRQKDTIPIKYKKPLTKEDKALLPYYYAESTYKFMRNAMYRYYSRTKTTTEDKVNEIVNRIFSKDTYSDLIYGLEVLKELLEIEDYDTFSNELDLDEFDTDYWFTGDSIRRNFTQLTNDLKSYIAGSKDSKKFIEQINIIDKLMREIIEIYENIEEEEEDINDDSEDSAVFDEEELREMGSGASAKESEEQEIEGKDSDDFLADVAAGESSISDAEEVLDDEEEKDFLDSELIRYIKDIDDNQLYDAMNYMRAIKVQIEDFIKLKNITIYSPDFIKIIRDFSDTLKYPKKSELEEILSKTKEETKENRVAVKKARSDLDDWWVGIKDNIKKPEDDVFIKIIETLDLNDIFSDALFKDQQFNNAKHGKVELMTKNMELKINFQKGELTLKGYLAWKSQAESFIAWKKSGQHVPIVDRQHLDQAQQKKIGGKRMHASGRKQLRAEYGHDEVRFIFYQDVRKFAAALKQAVGI